MSESTIFARLYLALICSPSGEIGIGLATLLKLFSDHALAGCSLLIPRGHVDEDDSNTWFTR